MSLHLIPVAEASVESLVKSINKVIINPLITLLFALAMVYFIYGAMMFLLSPDNEEARTTSKQHMIWGIIGLAIMVSVYGLLNIVTSSLGAPNVNTYLK